MRNPVGKKKDDAMQNVADTDRALLTPMILFYLSNKGLVVDRQLLDDLNKFMHINILDLQTLMRSIATEHKLLITPYKLPLGGKGQFGTFIMIGVQKAEQG